MTYVVGMAGPYTLKLPNEVAQLALDWNPQGGRGRGRLKAAWRATVLEEEKS
jgi:hypothetical protein